jgi:predicted ferric reductase
MTTTLPAPTHTAHQRQSAAPALITLPRRPGRWWRDVAGSAAMGSIAVVLVLWVRNGGVQDLSGADRLSALGRLAGLLSADLLLVQVLLMSRIPWVERAYGQDALARRHRLVGFWSFWLLIAHVVVITLGYAASAHTGVLAEAWNLVATYPGMLLATAATGLLVAVVVTSIRAARRRLRYESWHLIHLYAYLGVGLALPHQLWTGTDFVGSAWARAYWWTAYVATLTSVLVFRAGLPLWRSARHRLVVAHVATEAPGVVSVYVRGRRLDRLPVRSGQFFLWRFLDGPGWSRAHPYSLSAAPRPDWLRITVKDLGDGSARVASLRPGTRVMIEGPYGAMTATEPTRRPLVMFAAGVGVTAIRALLEDPDLAHRPVTLLYRLREPADAVFARELEMLAASRPLRVHYLIGQRPAWRSFLPAQLAPGPDGDAAALRHLVPDVAHREAYLCGPPAWMESVRAALVGAGMPVERIRAEEFAW